MFFAKTLLATAAFTTLAQALVALTNTDFSGITVGVPFNVTWTGQSGVVTLKLKNGPSDNQLLVDTLADGLADNSYEWTPASDLPEGTYNLEIDDSNGDINYSPQFEIVGGTALPITSAPYPAPTYVAGVTTVVPVANTTVVVPQTNTTVVAPISTGGPSYGNMTTSSVIYSNTTMTTASNGAPSTTVSGVPPPASSTVVTAGAIRQAVQPLAGMLLGVAGIAFLF